MKPSIDQEKFIEVLEEAYQKGQSEEDITAKELVQEMIEKLRDSLKLIK